VRSGRAVRDRETDRIRRSVAAVFDRETERLCGELRLCVTERRKECSERWGCV